MKTRNPVDACLFFRTPQDAAPFRITREAVSHVIVPTVFRVREGAGQVGRVAAPRHSAIPLALGMHGCHCTAWWTLP